MDYSKLKEITVKTQAELDAIPENYKGRIYIEFGTQDEPAVVNRRYYRSVEARNNSSVVAWDKSSVEACDNSSVVAWDKSSVVAWGNSNVEACDNSSVEARNNSSVIARDNSNVEACDNSSVIARDNSNVEACDNSNVEARNNSSVIARDNSSVEACDNSSVVACDNSSVVAWGNTQVNQKSTSPKIKTSENARIVYDPKNTNEYIDFYGIKHTKTQATLYKAVHKIDGRYVSHYDKSFEYEIGKIIKAEIDPNTYAMCGRGIHISHLNWALGFGSKWDDLAILEVTTRIEDIVCPENTDGKVRTSRVKVIREVPMNECGVYGKILANRRKQQ